ncbi:MAG: TetR/AcrR family transcriptional regulator [Mycobacteriaceae bacterium]
MGRAMRSMAHDARSEATRLALVHACVDALRELGATGATAREVGARSGVNQALVFYHFGSMNALFLAALDHVSSERMTAYGPVVADAQDAAALFDGVREILVRDLNDGHVTVLIEVVAAAQRDPAMLAEIRERIAPWKDLARTALERALPGGRLSALAPSSDTAAHAVMAGLIGMQLLSSIEGDAQESLRLVDEIERVAMWLTRLSKPTRRGRP